MVVFTCQYCGESLQKPKVDKHYLTKCCYKNPSLTCVDCLKDFVGDDYKSHTQCVSEAQRYSALGTVIKESKGKNKQAKYTELVQNLLNSKNLTYIQRQLLQVCSNFENVPRKQKKFHNFMMNAGRQIKYTVEDVNSVFKLLEGSWKNETLNNNEKANTEMLSTNVENNSSCKDKNVETNGYHKNNDEESKTEKNKLIDDDETLNIEENSFPENDHSSENTTKNRDKMKKKQIKKQKKYEKYLAELEEQSKEAKENVEQEEPVDDLNIVNKKKKSKKSKHHQNSVFPSVNGSEEVINAESEGVSCEKNTKRKHNSEVYQTPEKKRKVQLNDEDTDKQELTFDWADIIIKVLEARSDKELSLKRLGKKVVNEYLTVKPDHRTHDELLAKFNKKVHKTKGVKVLKDKAILCTN